MRWPGRVDTKPVFREALQHRRCIVPVDDFYEWKNLEPKEAALGDYARRSVVSTSAARRSVSSGNPTFGHFGLSPSGWIEAEGEGHAMMRALSLGLRPHFSERGGPPKDTPDCAGYLHGLDGSVEFLEP